MAIQWFKNAVIYCIDVDTFKDGNGDGIGDFVGLRQSLSYLAGLGVTCIWLLPFYPSPDRDNGYDITDYLSVHPALGDLGDFAEFMDEAANCGIRVIIDLVVNHTSNEHPWFKAAQRRHPKYYSYYVWRKEKPPDTKDQVVFPGRQSGVWQYSRTAKAYYFHRFYEYQPDLNTANPAVRAEIKKIMGFWLASGVSGFRVDAAPFVIAQKGPEVEKQPHESFDYINEFREFLSWRRGDALFLAEANVAPDQMLQYFGKRGDRMNMVFNFFVNPHLFLAIANESPEPLLRSLLQIPTIPNDSQWGYFLRNHDELDLSRLTELERARCFEVFGPDKTMQLYARGIRRRLAPMFSGNVQRQMLAFSLIFTIPGTPIIWYGDEIGMGDDLSQAERNSVRTPMQWSAETNAGFSTAPAKKLRRRVIDFGPFDYRNVNVQAERRDPASLLNRIERMIRTRKEYPEFACGKYRLLESSRPDAIFAHACEDEAGNAVLAIHNLSHKPVKTSVHLWTDKLTQAVFLFGGNDDAAIVARELQIGLDGYGYNWIRPFKSNGVSAKKTCRIKNRV
ncbi:MAG: alpha-amylase family protein [Verrucomicrobia bacterium]|nr:alpha-amylase family protein [Verrucomicrobiota bacterium]